MIAMKIYASKLPRLKKVLEPTALTAKATPDTNRLVVKSRTELHARVSLR
jgi:hypothetical protein